MIKARLSAAARPKVPLKRMDTVRAITWAVTVIYDDGGDFQRIYGGQEKAQRFTARQKKPIRLLS
jgi:hypothetical protein